MESTKNSKPKLLIVDDEADNLDLLYRTFRRDYKVLKAVSGPAALEILEKEGDVAVIISDQRMPLMSGTEFLSRTATQYPEIIRIILTGYTDVEDLVEAINTGKVFKYVTKPWDELHLMAVVQQALDTHYVLKARTRDLSRIVRQESLLNAITITIRSALDYRQILQTIVDTVGQMFETDVCILRPFQNEQMADECFVYQGKVLAETPNPEKLQLLRNTVWKTLEVLAIHDSQRDERLQGDTPELRDRRLAYSRHNIHSSLIVPLIYQQELMAVLALHQCEQRVWPDDDVNLIVMVSDQAALALSQSRAYEQVRSLAKREALINTITAAIRSSLDPQEIFAAIVQQLGQALQVDGCALSLWTKEDEFVQCMGLYEKIASPVGGSGKTPGTPISQSVVPIAGNPVLQQLLTTQQPVAIADLLSNPQEHLIDLPLREPARALLLVPLLYDGEIIGSISLRENRMLFQPFFCTL